MKIANFDRTYETQLGGGMGGGSIIASAVAGRSVFKPSAVRVATTVAGTLASDFEAGDTVDGVTLAEGDRILIKDQAAGAENGVYVVEATGTPTRAEDFDSSSEIVGAFVTVIGGTANASTTWHNTNTGPVTVDTTALTFETLTSTPATTVTDETTFGITPAAGTDTSYAREDHTHGSPSVASIRATGQRILLADGRSAPFSFEDMLQMDDGSDFMWSD